MPLGMDLKTLYFFVTCSAVPVLSVCSLLPVFGRGFSFYCYKWALIFSLAAFSFRILYATKRPTEWNFTGLRAWASSVVLTNNFQYCMYCTVFLLGHPVTIALLPPAILCIIQWATIASKLLAENAMWIKYGAGLFDKLQANMVQAIVMVSTVEISTAFMLIFELFTRSRNPLRLMLYWNFLRMRYKCTDNTVLRIKYTHSNTAYYHQQVWTMLGDKAKPVLGLRFIQPALNFAKTWFTGVPHHAQA